MSEKEENKENKDKKEIKSDDKEIKNEEEEEYDNEEEEEEEDDEDIDDKNEKEIEKIENNKNISANEKIVDKNEIQIKESNIEIYENIKNKEDNDIKTEDKEQSINKEKKETNQENKTDENIIGDENKNHEIKQIEASKTIINETENTKIKEKVNEIKNEIEVSQKLINENKKEIKEKEKNISSPKKEEKSFRPHYVFYYKPYKRVGGSDSNNVSSMTYFNGQGKDRPNYQFYCSYGSSKSSSIKQKTNNTKEKEINNSPIGIASTSKISQKNKSYIPSSRTETKNSKTVNIFKPVPKTIVPAKKYIDKFQENKKEENKKTNDINYRYITSNSYQRNKNENINQPKKYYAKCPHCNFVLNDEVEVKKYYNNLNHNNNDKNKINNYTYNNKRKINIQNKNNENNKTYDFSSYNSGSKKDKH